MSTVIEIHPEELFDKLSLGSLSQQEGERLRAHLASCAVCRFELEARGDFDDDLRASLGARAPEAEPALPLRLRSGSRRRRPVIWLLSAAAIFVATGALAGVVTGKPPWELVASVTAPTPDVPAPHPTAGHAAAVKPKATPVALHAVPSADAPSTAVPADVAVAAPAPVAPVPASATLRLTGAPASASALFADANRARASGDAAHAIQLYRSLQRQFPRSREAELSQLTLARLFLDSGDARSALGGFDAYLGRGGRTLQAEALVGRALSLRSLGRRDAEIAAWRDVLEHHPRSVYARQATERLSALGRL